ncbi:helix-turn-helix domain-containing protein [Azorhizobium doebereinerae]|uniref:helix-turn-helix domain-containing protein n=1 Tax=Azorhizobium doebereinerae TaxID=281091 RepID=UPI0004148EB1|nr:helix-turn-helix domain-containing protein [Azorhizobium doebereinerae]
MIERTSPETAARARALYAQGVPVKAISAETGLSTRQIYYWLDREAGAPKRPGRLAPEPTTRRRRADLARPPGAVARRRLMGRLWKAAEGQIAEIEARLDAARGEGRADADAPPPRDSERDARALAVLARVMRDLSALDAAARRERADGKAAVARDPSAFRAELARRLERLRAGVKAERGEGAAEGPAPAEPPAPG